MPTIFDPSDRAALLRRLEALQPSSLRQWGTMNPAQMLAHCSIAMEMACGDTPSKQVLIGRILGPLVRWRVLGDKPLRKNVPTSPLLVVADERDFAGERRRLEALVERFAQAGPSGADDRVHMFFGRLTGDQWGRLMYKHLDHHLRQFTA
jgi:Protein of unknown function (DUF1569)